MNGHLGGTQNTLHIIALSRLAPPAKILDMGAGAGETVGLLRDMGYDARGIDIRPGNDMVEKGDFLRCPYPDAAFDGIISQCAFFVGGDVSGAFSEAYRLLKGGGVLMLTDVCFEDVEGIAGKKGFAVMHSEDMTARWQEYYIDAVWRGEECRHEQRGKCEYRMLICGKE